MAPISSSPYLPSIIESTTALATRLLHSIQNIAPPSWPPTSQSVSTNSLPYLTEFTPSLLRRQTIVAIPATYANQNSGPKPGTVVGIVLGSVAGFLLLLWLVYTAFNAGGSRSNTTVFEEEVIRRRSRSPRRAPSRRSVSRSEVIEVSRHRSPVPPPRSSPPRREVRRESIVVEEEIRRPAPRDDDIVEVIEEHSISPPRRQRSQRASGYRPVDPEAFGGGDRPLRPVSGSRR